MGKPHVAWRQVVTLDTRLSAYRIELTRRWAKEIGKMASQSVLLSGFVYDFVAALRSVTVTASLPHTLVRQFKGFVDAYVRGANEPTSKLIIDGLVGRLSREVQFPTPELRQQVALACLRIAGDAHAIHAMQQSPPFSEEYIWSQYFKEPGFQLTLFDSQRQGFVTAFNAYESFLVRCVGVALNRQSFRRRKDEIFSADVTEAFGESVYGTCWDNTEILLFREARNAFTHNGGRETPRLKELKHPFPTNDERLLQLGPHYLMHGLRVIERCTDCLVASAVAHERFRRRRRSK
jgi:hypothetical protein